MCVLPIRGRPLPRPVPVLDLTLLMFERLLIFQLFSQPAMTQLIRKYDSSLGDWIPLLQNCGILTQISRRHISCFSHSPSNNQGGSPWWASISGMRGAKEIVPDWILAPGLSRDQRGTHWWRERAATAAGPRLLSQHQSGWTKLPSVKTTFG